MSTLILAWVITTSQMILGIAMFFATARMLRGPRAQDRVLGLDALYVCAMLLLVTLGIQTGRPFYFEGALIIGILGFASTLALSKFLLRGEVIE
jgi:multicomponent K+:H+ antiporter subunit F